MPKTQGEGAQGDFKTGAVGVQSLQQPPPGKVTRAPSGKDILGDSAVGVESLQRKSATRGN